MNVGRLVSEKDVVVLPNESLFTKLTFSSYNRSERLFEHRRRVEKNSQIKQSLVGVIDSGEWYTTPKDNSRKRIL